MKTFDKYFVEVDYKDQFPETYKGVVLTKGKEHVEVLRINTGDFLKDLAIMDTKYPTITKESQVITSDSMINYVTDLADFGIYKRTDSYKVSNLEQRLETIKLRNKCNRMTTFIQERKMAEPYNHTVMKTSDMFKDYGVQTGQHELDTMKELVDQFLEVKGRLTALYEMGNDETGRELQDQYDRTGLEY